MSSLGFFDVASASIKEWEKLHSFRILNDPSYIWKTVCDYKKIVTKEQCESTLYVWTLSDAKRGIAVIIIEVPKNYILTINANIVFAKIIVDKVVYSKYSSIVLIMKKLEEYMLHNKKNIVGFCSSDQKISSLLEFWGGEIINIEKRYQLQVPSLNWALINEWKTIGSSLYSVRIFVDEIPSQFLENCVIALTAILRERTDQDKNLCLNSEEYKTSISEIRKKNNIFLACAIFEKTKIIGMSEIVLINESGLAKQRVTGVLKEYRCQGLAKRLKAEILNKLKEFKAIQRVETGVFSKNIPIQKINEKLNFRLYYQNDWINMSLSKLSNRLEQLSV